MRILAIERELSPLNSQQHDGLLREEAARIWALKKQDVLRDIWFTQRDRRAILMLECAGEEEARQHLLSLPLVRDHFIDFEVCALRTYDGFDRLVKEQGIRPVPPSPAASGHDREPHHGLLLRGE